MDDVMPIIFAAVVVEGLVSYINMFFKDGKIVWQNTIAICLGVLISIAYGLDLFELMHLQSNIKYLGMILTGILISRGSNYMFELIRKLSLSNKNNQKLHDKL